MVLLTALRHGATPGRVAQLRAMVGISRRTLERWRRWWQEEFSGSRFWKWARGRLAWPVDEHRLPLSLLESFLETRSEARAIDLLRFILPLTTTSLVQET